MKNSENFKIVWWGILVVVIGYYIFDRYPVLVSGKPTYLDVVVFLVWVGVCLAPIFQEMDLFGVKLKQKIEDLQKDVNHKLSILKTELKSSIEVSAANNNQIYVNTNQEPPKDSEIPDLRAQIEEVLEKKGISAGETIHQKDFTSSIEVEMFKVRLAFEKLIRRYSYDLRIEGKRRSIGQMLHSLSYVDGVSKEIVLGAQEIISICNYAVHGEKLTDKQISFVRESYSGLLEALERELENAL